jgi:hypothetical protein
MGKKKKAVAAERKRDPLLAEDAAEDAEALDAILVDDDAEGDYFLTMQFTVRGYGREADQEKSRKFVERYLRSALHDGNLVVRIAHVERI